MQPENDIQLRWWKLEEKLIERFGRKPDMETILFLIGIQEFGDIKQKFTKEPKQDLMHIAICHLLEEDGYFKFEGMDADGWPHWKPILPVDIKGLPAQEAMLRRKVIEYFAPLLSKNENS